ncbi:MAG: Gfo/Idh/MocA family protein [Eubacteriales bacterium]|jgi:predicted dehydrogenase|nr:Gfo/Idh/MocA family oxidoreductase [Clostridiales bacterium]
MSGKIRVGFVGVGFMGQAAHLSNYATLGELCEVVAVAEPRKKLAEAVAKRYGIPQIYGDHTELLAECELDAVVASQPYSNHINIVPDILRAKKPLFTEKPIAVSVESGKRLAALAKENGVLYMVGYHKRSDPAMEYAKKLVDEWKASGEYGRMRFVRITMPPGDWVGGGGSAVLGSDDPYPPLQHEGMPDYFDEETGQEYNAFVNYYIHQVNAMRFFFGEPYKVTYADKSGVLLVAESESGVCGTLEMAPYNTTLDWQESYLVAFERGYIKVDLPAPLASQEAGVVTVMRDNGKEPPTITRPVMPKVHAMKNQAVNFIAAVKGERPAPCTADEAVEDLKIARDYISLKRGLE